MDSSHITQSTQQAATWLKQGQLLAYPTESVWGIGCDAYNEEAVSEILTIKQRPIDKGMIVVTDSLARIQPLIETLPSLQQKRLLNVQLAQPLQPSNDNHRKNTNDVERIISPCRRAQTWLLPLPEQNNIPAWITGAHHSVAVRIIDHPLIKKLCHQIVSKHNPYGFIISTSCNIAGEPPAKTLSEAYNYFDSVIYYLEGQSLGYTQPSQIIDAITGDIVR